MDCSNCGAANDPGQKFCGQCGASLVTACPNCGSANPADRRFCGECGTSLANAAGTAGPGALETGSVSTLLVAPAAAQVVERRLVSVLFADLVGYTPYSEAHDPEDVRETLDRYFEVARNAIERHGGTIEKFIGDAVMAVWGAPVAREDDAERAVRAGLELVDAVAALGVSAREL
jgi:class 3 adenylate cyclase/predicted nucleic acid-binding Zn ribbon protein